MDIGRPLIFLPMLVYCFYTFWKNKEEVYLLLGILSWIAAIYSGTLNIYQFLQDPIKIIIDILTILLLIMPSVYYVGNRIKGIEK